MVGTVVGEVVEVVSPYIEAVGDEVVRIGVVVEVVSSSVEIAGVRVVVVGSDVVVLCVG